MRNENINFCDKLVEKIKKTNNPSVIGLDPKIEYVPKSIIEKHYKEYGVGLKGAAEAILYFNKKLIDTIYDIAPVVKPQSAYYEMYGIHGVEALKKTIDYAKSKGVLVIGDVKRNDIGSTAEAYSCAYLGDTLLDTNGSYEKAFNSDCITVNPYLGEDGIKPFITDCEKHGTGIFVLVKTSNPSSSQLQDLVLQDGSLIYEKVAELVDKWGGSTIGGYGYSSIGAVVGATYPAHAQKLRKIMRKAYFLVPGYGAQGGTADDAAANFNDDGLGAIVNASRSVMCAYMKSKDGEEAFEEATRAEVIRMRDDLNGALNRRFNR